MSFPADLQAQIDALEPAIRAAFIAAVQDMRSAAQVAVVIDALERGDMPALYAALNIDPRFFAPLDRAITQAYIEGGIRALAGLPVIPDPVGPGKSSSASTGAIPVRSGGQTNIRQR